MEMTTMEFVEACVYILVLAIVVLIAIEIFDERE